MVDKNYMKKYSIVAICFVVAVFVVKFFEAALNFSSITSFVGFVYGNLISCGFVVAAVFVVYLLVSLFSNKTAVWVASTLFGIMMLTEVGLSIYYASTGILMGKELIFRPLWETLHTIKSAINIWMLIGVVFALIAYVALSVRFSKKNISTLASFIVAVVALVSIPLFFTVNVNKDKVIVNKTMYFIRECIKKTDVFDDVELSLTKTDYNPAVIEKYLKMFPERRIIDKEYPLERKDDVDNVLGPYFKKSKHKPNIVIIIVESLGTDLFGVNPAGTCYTPFLDSLSKHSLLWVNCMAATPRSFGAVPAITGSVPHGLKGFQFGDMPDHNSLFTILADNGYRTNAFYAGNFSFDRVYDYLVAQNIDYMSPFYEEFRKDKSKERDGTYWGYHDDVMFQKSLKIIEKRDGGKPEIDLFVTISQHEDLQLYDKNLQKRFYDTAEALRSPQHLLGKMAATLYTDDAIGRFIRGYSRTADADNTIFIITGDHSMNLDDSNPLNAFHVPLIIWSPLLEKTGRFEAMVSHNDITPSVLALLHGNFGLNTPQNVSWVSEGLDTVAGFHSNIRNYFLHYSRELKDFVWNDYYYTMADNSHPVARIVEGVKLEKIDDESLGNDLNDKFKTMVYVDNYVYSNNKLVKKPILSKDRFSVIKTVNVEDSVYCASNKEKPSVKKPRSKMIFTSKFDGDFSEIKLIMTADIKYTGKVWQDKFISLVVDCKGKQMEDVYSSDYIAKYIMERYPTAGKWQKLELSKVISVNNSDNFELKVYLLPTHKDDFWDPEHTVTLKDVKISVLGATD